jgi:hypothetical protein
LNRTIESLLRFVNLTTAGLLAGSLGFGEAALVPGWKDELPRVDGRFNPKVAGYFNAIGPVALGTAITLAVAAPRGVASSRRVLDSASALGLAGVLAATVMVTVPINKQLDEQPATDYPSERTTLVKNWSRAHAVRTTLGIGAFVCAVAASNIRRHAK